MSLKRDDPVIRQNLGLGASAEHQRYVRTVDIRVKQTDSVAKFGQRDRQIHRKRGFPHAAFPGTDGNNGRHSGQRLWGRRLLSGTRGIGRTQRDTFLKPVLS